MRIFHLSKPVSLRPLFSWLDHPKNPWLISYIWVWICWKSFTNFFNWRALKVFFPIFLCLYSLPFLSKRIKRKKMKIAYRKITSVKCNEQPHPSRIEKDWEWCANVSIPVNRHANREKCTNCSSLLCKVGVCLTVLFLYFSMLITNLFILSSSWRFRFI